jgi:hypothetical protein
MMAMLTGRERTAAEFDLVFAAAGFRLERVVRDAIADQPDRSATAVGTNGGGPDLIDRVRWTRLLACSLERNWVGRSAPGRTLGLGPPSR